MQHSHDKFPGVITCVCVRCCETFLRSGRDVSASFKNERITSDLIRKCLEENNFRTIIPISRLDKISLLNNLCNNCIKDMGFVRFFR